MSLLLKPFDMRKCEDIVPVEGPWVEALHTSKQNPLTVTYVHTIRKALAMIDTSFSTLHDSQQETDLTLLEDIEDYDGDTSTVFKGEQTLWNNNLRLIALQDGLENHLPVVLYLLRPETAFSGALHFLAHSLGGANSYEAQRKFIFQNTGLMTLLEPFWKRLQEIHWSGGFSPGISEDLRMRLILCLIECYNQSAMRDDNLPGGDALPTPHLGLGTLRQVGVHLPSIGSPEEVPTAGAEAFIGEQVKRQNLPGIPTDISSHLTCSRPTCNRIFASREERIEHKVNSDCSKQSDDTLGCTSCGLKFTTEEDFNIHLLTFCRHGPPGGKCPCCGTPGPSCLCTQHWRRTYELANSIYEGSYREANWPLKKEKDHAAAGLLILGSMYLGCPLGDTNSKQSPNPIALNAQLWGQALQNVPKRTDTNKNDFILYSGKEINLKDVQKELQRVLEGDIKWVEPKEPINTGARSSLTKSASNKISLHKKHFGRFFAISDMDFDDMEELNASIDEIESILKNPRSKKIFLLSLGVNEKKLQTDLEGLKTIQMEAAQAALQKLKVKDRKEKLKFEDSERKMAKAGLRDRSKSDDRSRKRGSTESLNTATSIRGSSKTQTLLMTLQRSMNILMNQTVDGGGTAFKRSYNQVRDDIGKCEDHLKFDESTLIDMSYSEDVEEALQAAEDLLDRLDEKGDTMQREKERERQKERELADLRKFLPKAQPQKWNGDINGFPKFKKSCQLILSSYPSDEVAMDAILQLVENKDIRSKLKIYKNPREALESLELTFGKPELSGPKIRDDMKNLSKASTMDEECEVILKIRQHWAELSAIDQLCLISKDVLLNLCHKLRPDKDERILEKIQGLVNQEELQEVFLESLDKQYTLNTMMKRTSSSSTSHRKESSGFKKSQTRRADTKSILDRSSVSPKVQPKDSPTWNQAYGQQRCDFGCKEGHRSHNCPRIFTMGLGQLKTAGICPYCLQKDHTKEDKPNCHIIKSPRSQKEYTVCCQKCGYNKRLKNLHEKCGTVYKRGTEAYAKYSRNELSKRQHNVQQPLTHSENTGTSNLRMDTVLVQTMQFKNLLNPTPIGSSLEIVDYLKIEAPDGSRRRCRVIHDEYGAQDTMADLSLSSYSHGSQDVHVTMGSATGDEHMVTDLIHLKVILPDNSYKIVKAISANMRSKKAFTIAQKMIDVPRLWNEKYFSNRGLVGTNNELRFYNQVERTTNVDILLGADNLFLAPIEIERYADNYGCATVYRSPLQTNLFLIGGGRLVGEAAVPACGSQQRRFQVSGSDRQVSVRRTTTVGSRDEVLYPANPIAKMSKLDQKFFNQFEDNNTLPPHPRACQGCEQCSICSDISHADRRKATENLLDKLCTLDTSLPWPEGGWRICLLWSDLISEVPVNKEGAIRRFLATEKALSRNPQALRTFNDKMSQCIEAGYFSYLDHYKDATSLDGLQQSYLPLSYALKDDPLDEDEENQVNHPGKTKARPVSDGSHQADASTPSVNTALVDIPDIWTEKIQNILLQFRTSKLLGLADISHYYHRLRLDPLSVSMTRAIFREGGVGSTGELKVLVAPSASMGLKPVPSLASHCRARTAALVKDEIAQKTLMASYCDDVYTLTMWKASEGKVESEMTLLNRTQEISKALNVCCLELGGNGWVTDLNADQIPAKLKDVTGVTTKRAHRDIGVSTTGALGLRWNLGADLPEGGTMSYRVHRPGSLNLLPKRRGQRPPEGELRSRKDIQRFLQTRGLTKASLLGLVMNLFDALQLALPWTATAKLIYREILAENPNMSWKSLVPVKYLKRIEDLAVDLLDLSRDQFFPRRAIHEGQDGTVGFLTLILVHDGCKDSACCLAYIHQQWPKESVHMPIAVSGKEVDCEESKITTVATLLCGAHKLTQQGHEEQVAGELLSMTIAVRLKQTIMKMSLVEFDKVLYLGDSLTVARAVRKSSRAYNQWAATRISFIQRNEDLDRFYHVPGDFLVPTADKGTRSHKAPSTITNDEYWSGKGTLDRPLHLLPITDPDTYSTTGMESLPKAWVNKSLVRLHPTGQPNIEVACRRVEIEEDVSTELVNHNYFYHLKVKYRSWPKIIRIMCYCLKLSPRHNDLEPNQIWDLAISKWIQQDLDILTTSLKVTKVPKTLIVSKDAGSGIYYVRGRQVEGEVYRTPLLANPQKSQLSRLICKYYHDLNHMHSPAYIQALMYKDFYILGGWITYLKKIADRCHRCKILHSKPEKAISGESPNGTQGPLKTDQSIWRRWMLDIAGPLNISPWVGRNKTRASAKVVLKHWILVCVDLCSRQIDACLLEGYSSNAVLTGMRELMGRHGTPQKIFWDRASNLHAAAAVMKDKDDEEIDGISLTSKIKVQEELKRNFESNGITVYLSIPYSSWRQGRVEAAVKQLKLRLVELLYNEAETRLTPLEASSALSTACSVINQRPLLLLAEATLDERNILSPGYLTCADLDLQNTSCSGDPNTWRQFNSHETALNKRASMVQERIEIFKEKFLVFMTKALTSLGRFNQAGTDLEVGDVCLILDKKKATLPVQSKSRFTLGVIEEIISPRSFKLRYGNKMGFSTCERSIQGLSLIAKKAEFYNASEKDVVIDPLF